ncbi:MAG: sugar ABC transporter permease [Butyrivibrio sp.]|uniref:carbohydrate ABC transporter permease n=1 Tax=Butyrivibrio sp. TaxID=28121 RepID=UPI001B1482C9|nr:sugar ABC transporter permease [Butyrivibrio sp.]MBO6241755.1 sugar ABC transporter permease [Butyrivibrio sp.]MBP3817455.1 sugar ABC transporter permease [Butyrivibrio sp.]MBQ9305198.1 sugar ABC transporter permease [Butyrivibrio sp.]
MRVKNKKVTSIKEFLLFGFPSFFIWFSVVIIPFVYGLFITFTDWNGLSQDINFIGIENYKNILTDSAFLGAFWKTVVYALFTVILSNLIGFILALVVTSGIKGQNLFRTGFFTPNIIGGIILGYIWNFIFSFGLTKLGEFTGISWMQTSWLTNPVRALMALIIVSAWQMSGYLMVIYIAGLTAVPADLMEAARVDGATVFQTVMQIKIPMIRGTTAICVFLAISRCFMSFDTNLSLTAGGPYKSTELIAYKIYQTAFTSMDFGVGQAQAIILFVIVSVISLLQVYFTRRGRVDA